MTPDPRPETLTASPGDHRDYANHRQPRYTFFYTQLRITTLCIALSAACTSARSAVNGGAAIPHSALEIHVDDAHPGTLSGHIVDDVLHTGLPTHAMIIAQDTSATGRPRGAQSDSAGWFSLQVPPGRLILHTRGITYEPRIDTVDVPEGRGLSLVIPLTRSPFQLDRIVINDPATPLRVRIVVPPSAPRADTATLSIRIRNMATIVIREPIAMFSDADGWPIVSIARQPSTTTADVEVRVPGFRIWRDRAVPLSGTVTVVLTP